VEASTSTQTRGATTEVSINSETRSETYCLRPVVPQCGQLGVYEPSSFLRPIQLVVQSKSYVIVEDYQSSPPTPLPPPLTPDVYICIKINLKL